MRVQTFTTAALLCVGAFAAHADAVRHRAGHRAGHRSHRAGHRAHRGGHRVESASSSSTEPGPYSSTAPTTSSTAPIPSNTAQAAAPASKGTSTGGSYPFDKLVAFGDQLSDDGSGSWAHGLDPDDIYGFHTWTDGDVAVQYLARQLGVPLLDYAWGGIGGGGLVGSTVDNAYTPAGDSWEGHPVPSTLQQIANYSSGPSRDDASHSLHLLWVGQNDIKKHTNWYANPSSKITVDDPTNAAFITDFSRLLVSQAEHLVELGAPGVVVMDIYPIEKAPENWMFFCKDTPGCAERWGAVVQAANSHLQTSLAASRYADKLLYYSVYEYMDYVMENKDDFGFTAPLTDLCDGRPGLPTTKFQQCLSGPGRSWSGARPYFWFNNGQMATQVHELIAADLKKSIDSHFGG